MLIRLYFCSKFSQLKEDMPRIYRLSKTGTKLLYKIRHHKGHGVHSPFVFSFINRVIEEKTPYYAYNDIKEYLENFPYLILPDNKVNKFSFRLVNYFNPKKILELGAGNGINTLYITSASSDACCLSVELNSNESSQARDLYKEWGRNITQSSEEFPILDDIPDCIFINLRNYRVDHFRLIEYLLSKVKPNTFVFIDGIRTNKSRQMLWKELIQNQKVIVSMDLFEVGILFFDEKYFKRNYKLSF